ncbi:PhzF family phenazine biosynthesis protein [Cognatazoarcus halotolerans]|uniref:PhzF family phenazine biosynthesis protein n=1 Tax=Cognatazoarcus halotolerans TaxID=2686016 RepID=UPI00135B1366|nr:PhzF family phenazine biosynthesis protein [Cognatazoarcus halotolerans]MBX3678693.1 PhzF family phenazine biosynthesis protein [Rhodocyclaceae bacterium]MCB1899488.1 PhzF family phenazine biosynthesis protein [Rhodocyclaceae bacterium]MCP5309426.1 PhzF family phenazine biosynthesis protein [Zoogloeaceae bacterium]
MHLLQYQVDAFSDKPFQGNPAAVCPLSEWLPDPLMQALANENNLSETAFFVPAGSHFDLRWFTPTSEVDLCGHATLASAHVLFHHMNWAAPEVLFQTRSGRLRARKADERIIIDLPAWPAVRLRDDASITAALGMAPRELWLSRDYYLALFDAEQSVRRLRPDMTALARLPEWGLIATAPGDSCDFVSRFFAPAKGVPEDPVTGSAHCALTPFWAERLGKTRLDAFQCSLRGGRLSCEIVGDRVEIAGSALTVIESRLNLPDQIVEIGREMPRPRV